MNLKNGKIVESKEIIIGGEKAIVYLIKQHIKKVGYAECEFEQFRLIGEFKDKQVSKQSLLKNRLMEKFK